MNRNSISFFLFALFAFAIFSNSTILIASETDDQIKLSFENTYVVKTYLKDDAIKAEVKDGVVTLTGTVVQESHKTLAQETAANLPGVTRVDNQLATPAEVAAEKADYWIVKKVKFTLLLHRNVNAGKTNVEAQDGIVTLSGEAASQGQKDLTAEYAKDIEGVNGVKNEMTVAAAPAADVRTAAEKIDDVSVAAQVRTVLMAHRSTRGISTKIWARDGVVTLTGIARNEAEKALVSKIVSDIPGVTSLKNEMTVSTVNETSGPGNPPRDVPEAAKPALTPLDQGNSPADVAITTQIRQAILAEKNLSTNAQNVKIITIEGQVTLRGPVATAEEKRLIGEIAGKSVASDKVDNQLEVPAPADSKP